MKFDYAIGNPPYQAEISESSGNKTYSAPVYNFFLDEAFKVADKVEMIHPARFLFNAGSTPKAWNKKMLSDPHFKVMYYVSDSSSVFPATDIMGGVAISYHDKDENFGAIEVFVANPVLRSIFLIGILQLGCCRRSRALCGSFCGFSIGIIRVAALILHHAGVLQGEDPADHAVAVNRDFF